MKRIIAFFIDHMILSLIIVGSYFLLFFNGNMRVSAASFTIILVIGLCLWLGYFIAADYFFHGMTLGKKLLGLRMMWLREGRTPGFWAVKHTLLKWLLAAFWPVGFILYLACGCRMPYDQMLGISYPLKTDGTAGTNLVWKIIAGIVAVIAVFVMVTAGTATLVLNKISTEEYYTLKSEKVASVYTVLGKQKMKAFSSSSTTESVVKKYTYAVRSDGDKLAVEYMEYLIQNEGFQRDTEGEAVFDSNIILLKKGSADGNYQIAITITAFSNSFTVWLQCNRTSEG